MRTPQPAAGKDPLPLDLGAHLSPETGSCLMEAVSVFAGEPWSDAPACTHPLVGHLARLVNDTSSPPGRSRLRSFVPSLAATSSADPTICPRLALACLDVAMRERRSVLMAHFWGAAARELARESASIDHVRSEARPARLAAGLGQLRRRLYRRGPAPRAVEVAVAAVSHLPEGRRDRALAEMLERAVAITTSASGSGLPCPVARSSTDGLVRRG